MEDISPAPSLQEQLKNLTDLQNRIEATKKELGHLSRIEAQEKGNLQSAFNKSMVASRNRLNLWENHYKTNQRH